ncbi:hypothetical protein Scep_030372 [Stephania cephalantha]|uniref:Uncharacterized protein n=1 Tax=Stephania cephalantha TaxID=152367 RepID=A0AAP0DZN0_9MAGN
MTSETQQRAHAQQATPADAQRERGVAVARSDCSAQATKIASARTVELAAAADGTTPQRCEIAMARMAAAWTKQQRRRRWLDGRATAGSGAGMAAAAAAARKRSRHGIGNDAVNGAEQLRSGALSDRSILDKGCDSTKFDDAMEGYV